MTIDELLVDFDEMGFAPTTFCENPDEYACKWKKQLLAEIEQLENNMKSVLEIEKENIRKETAKEILNELIDSSNKITFFDCRMALGLDKLAKQFGLEIKE